MGTRLAGLPTPSVERVASVAWMVGLGRGVRAPGGRVSVLDITGPRKGWPRLPWP